MLLGDRACGAVDLDQSEQAGHRPGRGNGLIVWFEGLSAAGKTTVARALQSRLLRLGRESILLDGDQFRGTYSRDLGFSQHDRIVNITRAGRIARRFAISGRIVLAAFITPFQNSRQTLAKMFQGLNYLEVFCECPVSVCETRDPKGLYRLARSGKITDFTGITSPFEYPRNPDLVLPTHMLSTADCVDRVLRSVTLAGIR